MLLGPLISLGFRGLVVASSCCTFSKVARSMMASWRSGKTSHSSLGLSMRLWFLKDLVLVLKLITSPQYSCRWRMPLMVEHFHLQSLGWVFLPPRPMPLEAQ